MRHQLRAAIIGTGFAGTQHVDALRRLGIEIRAVVGSDPERAASAAARFGVERSSADYTSVVLDPEVDVVHVCVPNAMHAPVVRAALGAGKHVVCEKPLATTVADAFDLASRAREASVLAVVCHNYRFYPMAAELRLRVERGELGRPHLVRGAYLQDWLLAGDTTSWRVDPVMGGASRAVSDIGTHWIDLAECGLGSRVAAVAAWIGTVHPRRRDWSQVTTFERSSGDAWVDVSTEDQAAVLLRFEDGTPGALTLSQVAAGHGNDLRIAIDGSRGSAEWHQERPDELRFARVDGPVETVVRDHGTLSAGAASLARLPAGHPEGWSDALRNLLGETYAAVRGERDTGAEAAAPLPTFDDAARHVAFVEAVLRSHSSGRWVSVSDIVSGLAQPPATEVPS